MVKAAAPKTKKTVSKSTFSIPLFALGGKEEGTMTLPKEVFGVTPNKELLSQYTRVFLANQRQGTASTKTRSEVTGSTRKIYKQKGTGKARHGDIKAPVFVGGGIVGGPKPRDYRLKMSKKQKKQALYSALSLRYTDACIKGLKDEFVTMKPKTKEFMTAVKAMGMEGKKILLLVPKKGKNNLVLASRNIPSLTVEDVKNTNAYQVLNSRFILFVAGAVPVFTEHFLKSE